MYGQVEALSCQDCFVLNYLSIGMMWLFESKGDKLVFGSKGDKLVFGSRTGAYAMKTGLNYFKIYLAQFENKLRLAATSAQSALWLYQNDLRTPLFMLEGLCRFYRNVVSKKKVERLLVKFKKIEDALGAIDYYDAHRKFCLETIKNPELYDFFDNHYTNSLQEFEKILIGEGWLNSRKEVVLDELKKINKQLTKLEWPSEKRDFKALKKFFIGEVKSLDSKFEAGSFDFNELEDGLHEFRRRIRWLSIYAHALPGRFSLKKSDVIPDNYQEFCTPQIISSPFNRLPFNNRFHELIIFDYHFYALSYIIAQLGVLKDQGQVQEALMSGALACNLCGQNDSEAFVKALLSDKYMDHKQIASQAGDICQKLISQNGLLLELASSIGK